MRQTPYIIAILTCALMGSCGKPAYKRIADDSPDGQSLRKGDGSRTRVSDLNDDEDSDGSGKNASNRAQSEAEKKIESEIDKELANNKGGNSDGKNPGSTGPDQGTNQPARCSRQYQASLSSDIVIDGKYGPIPYHVTGDGTLEIKLGQTKGLFKLDFQLLSAKPYLAHDEAKKRMEGQSGTRIFTLLSDEEFDALKKRDPSWEKIDCTVLPIKSQVFTMDGKTIAVEYDPALPYAILPKSDVATFDREIGESLTFGNVKVKIIDIAPDLNMFQTGDVVTGMVHVRKIGAEDQKIRSDVGYRIEFDFGLDTNHNYALGFTGDWSSYLINAKQQDYNGLVVPVSIADDNKTEIIFQK